jgi:hypothetical protein
MRYHWGLGVGHLYAHHSISTSSSACTPDSRDTDTQGDGSVDLGPFDLGPSHENAHLNVEDNDTDCESDNPELGLNDRDPEGWEDDDSEDGNGEHDFNDMDFESEEDFVGM